MNLNIDYKVLEKITQGKLFGEGILKTLTTDSRKVQKDMCFWVLKGQKFDGHLFVKQALEQGANLIVSHTFVKEAPACLVVEDTLKALQALAKYHRQQNKLEVACITGSNGKSTTKQMLLAMLSYKGQTRANLGNLNNQIGVPLSLLEIIPQDKYGVFELGASHNSFKPFFIIRSSKEWKVKKAALAPGNKICAKSLGACFTAENSSLTAILKAWKVLVAGWFFEVLGQTLSTIFASCQVVFIGSTLAASTIAWAILEAKRIAILMEEIAFKEARNQYIAYQLSIYTGPQATIDKAKEKGLVAIEPSKVIVLEEKNDH